MEPSADPVFEALGLCQNGVANEDTTQTAQFQPPGFLQMQMQQMQMQQIQQQVMYAVQAHVQQQIQQTAESGTGQDATFKNPEAISAFAAAATTAALFYCQSLQGSMAPPIPEVPMAPYAWGTPPGWQMPWYPTGPCANEAAPEAPKEEVLCTPKKETGEHNSDGVTPSPVQHLNFGATPSDYGTAGYATLSPMILKLSEVVNTDCQSPTTASDRPSTGWQSETPEENAGAMLLQLLKGGAKEESRPAEGHITPSTASEEGGDSQRQALASSGQELLRQLRGGAEAKAQKGTQVLSAITVFGIIWFYCKILSACNHVYSHLKTTRHLVELSGGTAKSQAAFRTAQKAILTESWGLRLVFMATVLVGRPLAFFVKAENPLRFLAQSTLLLCNTAGAWILSNAHGVSNLQGCVITFLMAILVGLVLAGIKISGWELALGILCTALAAALLGLLSGGYFKEGELEAKLIGLCSVDSDCKESMEAEWRKKVTDLSRRGITAQGLLDFYKKLGSSLMPHYDASKHTTNDVFRQAIIPATREQRCAYALMAGGGPVKPDRMVTHSWQNKFRDLVAAVIADAVHENSFDLVARVLDSDVSVLETMLENLGTGSTAYWICAFSMNQHAGICGGNPNGDRDSVTGKVHETCSCNLPKMFNATPPLSDGRSIGCEMNKFDDMMALLAAGNPKFAQIVAVDQAFGLFTRAWCVAELVQADETHLKQHVKMHSRPLLVMKKESLQNLKVENMEASRPEDVDYILSRIPNKNVFNQKLQKLIFDKAGLLSTWFQLDAARQMEEVGNLLKWSLADDGRGEIWQFWSKWGKAGRAKDVPTCI